MRERKNIGEKTDLDLEREELSREESGQEEPGIKEKKSKTKTVTAGMLKVKIYPDAALKEPSADVEEFDENLAKFIDKMYETMSAHDGIGLAAPQVGVLKKIAMVEFEEVFYLLINPRLISQEGMQDGDEGCLSFPGIYAPVKRPLRVTVAACDATGAEVVYNVEGLLARAFLHEMDHLEGKLFIEHLSSLKRGMIRKKMYKRSTGSGY